ncbi:MAG: AAA family ATPase, partial [Clostridia bacterium]
RRMRPESLSFSGLHSYRDTQTLDFRALGADGLFGIFGPTGSGKSTILDAITLALYGSVDRALRRTRGLINLAEESAETSFTFNLAGERYRAERVFGREPGDRDSAHCDYARLVRYPEGDGEVVASGATATTKAVEELLGLSSSEFSRAVVLPQGKFDQFLRLTGAERARMLEHIFRLEMYGDTLAKRARGFADRLSGELASLDRARAELGDCSLEGLSAAREEYLETLIHYRHTDHVVEELEKNREIVKNLRAMTADLRCAERELGKLDADENRILRLREKLAKGRSAETMRSLFNRVRDERERVRKLEAQRRDMASKNRRAVSVHQRVLRRYEDGRRDGQQRLRNLESLSDRLKRAAQEEEELEKLQNRLAQADQACDELEGQIDRLKERRADLNEEWSRINVAANEAVVSRGEMEFTEEEEEEINELRDASRRFEECGKEIESVRESLRQKASSCRQGLKNLWSLYGEMPEAPSILRPEDVPVAADDLLEKAIRDVRITEDRWRKHLMRRSAAEMAAKLARGEPCPVCGSLDHPDPARDRAPDDGDYELELQRVREKREEVASWQRKITNHHDRWTTLRDETLRLRDKHSALRRRRRRISAVFGGEDGSDPTVRWHKIRDQKEKRMERIKKLQATVEKMRQREAEVRGEIARLDEKIEGAREQLQKARLNGERLRSLRDVLRASIAKVAGSESPAELTVRVDEEAASLRKSLDTAERAEKESRNYRDRMCGKLEVLDARLKDARESLESGEAELERGIEEASFTGEQHLADSLLESGEDELLEREISEYARNKENLRAEIQRLEKALGGRRVRPEELEAVTENLETKRRELDELARQRGSRSDALKRIVGNRRRYRELTSEMECLRRRRDTGEKLVSLLSGRKFVTFLASEHLADMTDEASRRLGQLTAGRFGLEMDESREFVVRDEHNGGLLRPVGSMSGGEIFLASLSLALALSSKIQLRGRFPLGFFFLDEGFGTLDASRLEVVMNSLERLRDRERMVGLISHVAEIKHRLSRFAEVIPAEHGSEGSKVFTRGLLG